MALYQKGNSGNPGGRPKADVRITELAREYTEMAIETLVACLHDKQSRVRVMAAEALLDRAWGKPRQNHEVANKGGLNITIELGEEPSNQVKVGTIHRDVLAAVAIQAIAVGTY